MIQPTTMPEEMPFKLRVSKFRHVFGVPFREQECYRNISITSNAHDGSFCAVNSKFLAIVTETSGGGSFLVLLLSEIGRIDVDHPRIRGHRGPVVDLKFNPFNDHEIASCSDDGTVKIWHLPEEGFKLDTNQWKTDLHGHQRRVDYIEWHPTAEYLLLSAGFDHQIVLWNVAKAEPVQVYRCHPDAIQSITWNRNGSLFATTCKDKRIRIIEPRTGRIIANGIGHQGPKTSKIVFLGDTNRLLSTGFGKQFERQIAIWNANDLSKALAVETIDFSAGVLVPFYDHDTRTIFLAGKGDGNIRYYELTDQGEPYFYFLSEYKSSSPQRCLGVMPKIGLDVTRNEMMRFYKLYATGSICEPISMIVPRKAESFQYDIYPDTPGPYPALSADEWISGIDRDPVLVSMKDRIGGVDMPKITTYRTFDSTPTIPQRGSSQRLMSVPVAEVAPTPKSKSNSNEKLSSEFQHQTALKKVESLRMPATSTEFNHIRNLRQPSAQRKVSRVQKPPPNPSLDKTLHSSHLTIPSLKQSADNRSVPNLSRSSESPKPVTREENTIIKREKFQNPTREVLPLNNHNLEIKKKVWNVDQTSPSTQQPIDEINYQQEYFKQKDEIQSLRELLLLKDNQIRSLEDELRLFKNRY